MILGVVAGRAEVDQGIAARTLSRFLTPLRARRRLVLICVLLAGVILGGTGDDQAKRSCQKKNQSPHRSIVTLKKPPRASDFQSNAVRSSARTQLLAIPKPGSPARNLLFCWPRNSGSLAR